MSLWCVERFCTCWRKKNALKTRDGFASQNDSNRRKICVALIYCVCSFQRCCCAVLRYSVVCTVKLLFVKKKTQNPPFSCQFWHLFWQYEVVHLAFYSLKIWPEMKVETEMLGFNHIYQRFFILFYFFTDYSFANFISSLAFLISFDVFFLPLIYFLIRCQVWTCPHVWYFISFCPNGNCKVQNF